MKFIFIEFIYIDQVFLLDSHTFFMYIPKLLSTKKTKRDRDKNKKFTNTLIKKKLKVV